MKANENVHLSVFVFDLIISFYLIHFLALQIFEEWGSTRQMHSPRSLRKFIGWDSAQDVTHDMAKGGQLQAFYASFEYGAVAQIRHCKIWYSSGEGSDSE